MITDDLARGFCDEWIEDPVKKEPGTIALRNLIHEAIYEEREACVRAVLDSVKDAEDRTERELFGASAERKRWANEIALLIRRRGVQGGDPDRR